MAIHVTSQELLEEVKRCEEQAKEEDADFQLVAISEERKKKMKAVSQRIMDICFEELKGPAEFFCVIDVLRDFIEREYGVSAKVMATRKDEAGSC